MMSDSCLHWEETSQECTKYKKSSKVIFVMVLSLKELNYVELLQAILIPVRVQTCTLVKLLLIAFKALLLSFKTHATGTQKRYPLWERLPVSDQIYIKGSSYSTDSEITSHTTTDLKCKVLIAVARYCIIIVQWILPIQGKEFADTAIHFRLLQRQGLGKSLSSYTSKDKIKKKKKNTRKKTHSLYCT